ncbi:unnamed protein product [Dracunculus medinensis]|uniref:Uncharacterized protein n=1 Tax=Dracunculus medinensis TaxID=318479 RepID=A0A0N4UH81_DRAME|nr:unnamed protein product [Dracunculus medinensis]
MSTNKDLMIKNNYDITEWILIKQAQSDGITKQQIDIWNLYLDEKDDLNRSMKSCTMQELNTCYMDTWLVNDGGPNHSKYRRCQIRHNFMSENQESLNRLVLIVWELSIRIDNGVVKRCPVLLHEQCT